MTTYNLNIANISFNSSLDSRDIQEELDNIESLKNDFESDLESLNNELEELESDLYDIENAEDYASKQNDIDATLEEIEIIREPEKLDLYIGMFGFDLGVAKWFQFVKQIDFPKLSSLKNLNEKVASKVVADLQRIDNYSKETIILVLSYSFSDAFWRTNFYSVANSRAKCKNDLTKFDNIFNKMPEYKIPKVS